MTIEIDNGSGFCFGVTTAIKKAEEELAKGTTLYCLGDIVHNGMECERLKQMGLITIDHAEMARLHHVKVLLRAHGEPPETYDSVPTANRLRPTNWPVVTTSRLSMPRVPSYSSCRNASSSSMKPHHSPITTHHSPLR